MAERRCISSRLDASVSHSESVLRSRDRATSVCMSSATQSTLAAGPPAGAARMAFSTPHARSATRAALLHLRALQALDASQAGGSHRDIAQALFGLEAIVLRWHEDGELRAQVRHLLRRAEFFMNGGYLSLAGVLDPAAKSPGDEPVR